MRQRDVFHLMTRSGHVVGPAENSLDDIMHAMQSANRRPEAERYGPYQVGRYKEIPVDLSEQQAHTLWLIAQAWAKHPELRLTQLLVAHLKPEQPCPEVFYAEDQVLREKLAEDL